MSRLLIALLFVSTSAVAECYIRSATVKDSKSNITRIADIKRYVTPVDSEHFKCTVSFRAEINHVWQTGEGQSVGANGDSIDAICSQALDSGRSYLLGKVSNGKVLQEQEMICSDRPSPEIKSVQIGDIVQISELAPHPQKSEFFMYRGAQCRWFVETDVNLIVRDLFQWQGIVCNVRKGEWQVIDKF